MEQWTTETRTGNARCWGGEDGMDGMRRSKTVGKKKKGFDGELDLAWLGLAWVWFSWFGFLGYSEM